MFRIRSLPVLSLLSALVLGACDNPVDPMERVAGDYEATTFSATFEGTPVDLLEEGVELEIKLNANGTTSGRFFVPAELNQEDAGNYTADLEGTWTLRGSTVEFEHSADTALRDMEFQVRGDRLEAEEDFGDGTLRIVLQKQ